MILSEYQNGNVSVTIYSDGTKVREWPEDEEPTIEFPESVDLKITDYCDLSSVCQYCHEQSTKEGKHGDLSFVLDMWKDQPAGTEVAIGGGNPLEHPGLVPFLAILKNRGIISNLTVNILHTKKHKDLINLLQHNGLIHGLGISYRGKKSLDNLPGNIDYRNVVFHIIVGLNTVEDCQDIITWQKSMNVQPKILLLGYKRFGNGKTFYNSEVKDNIQKWNREYIQQLLTNEDKAIIAFDNLALDQLVMKSRLPKQDWEELYQGEDGSHTFYVDAVRQVAALTSTSDKVVQITRGNTVRDVFKTVKAIKSQ